MEESIWNCMLSKGEWSASYTSMSDPTNPPDTPQTGMVIERVLQDSLIRTIAQTEAEPQH